MRIKADIFRLSSLDVYSSMSFAHTYLFQQPKKLLSGRCFWPAIVRRDHLFEDGVRVLREFGRGSIQTDLAFEGEEGFGSGPLHEFFDSFSKQFARKDLKLWRDTSDDDSNMLLHQSVYFQF
jgi:hypothetical protein